MSIRHLFSVNNIFMYINKNFFSKDSIRLLFIHECYLENELGKFQLMYVYNRQQLRHAYKEKGFKILIQ